MNRILIVIMLLTALSCSRKAVSEKSNSLATLKDSYNSSMYNADSTGIIFYSLDSTMNRGRYQFGVFNVSLDSLVYKGKIENGKVKWESTEYVMCSEYAGISNLNSNIRRYYINLNTGETTTTITKKL